MRFGLDLDGVLYNFDKTAQYMAAKYNGLQFREEQAWDHAAYWRNLDGKTWDWLWKNCDPLFRHGHLYRGAIEFVYELAQRGEVHVVTKRPYAARKVTEEWLRFHWGEAGREYPISSLTILSDEPKTAVPADIYIDDLVPIAQEIVTTSDKAKVILMRRPWNEKLDWVEHTADPTRVILCDEFDDALWAIDVIMGRDVW